MPEFKQTKIGIARHQYRWLVDGILVSRQNHWPVPKEAQRRLAELRCELRALGVKPKRGHWSED